MKKSNIIITIKKELRSIFRDKKTIFMILGFPLIIAFFVFFYGEMEDSIIGGEDTKYPIGINYELNSTEKRIMSECSLEAKYYENISLMSKAYQDGKIDSYIDYNKEKDLYTIYSSEDIQTSQTANYAAVYLDTYNKYLGDQYIKGEDIENTSGEDLSTSNILVNMVMNISFVYIITAIAMATVNMATSAIATEKENGTLETILTLPVNIKELITGKYIATVIMGIISSIIGLILTITSLTIAKNMYEIYKDFKISFIAIIFSIIICIIASLLISAIALMLTSKAKSYKEAQAAGQVLQIICIFPMILSFIKVSSTALFYIIPILNHTTILMDLYSGNINYLNILLTIISTIVYTIILLYVLIKKFKSEKVLFGA